MTTLDDHNENSNDNVLIVIPFVDQVGMTNRCVKSILPTLGTNDLVILFSNGSKPGNLLKVQGLYAGDDRVDVVNNDMGMPIANIYNYGIGQAVFGEGYKYLVLMHNDCVIRYNLWLTEMKLALDNRGDAPTIVVPRSGTGNCVPEQLLQTPLPDAFTVLQHQTVKGYCMMFKSIQMLDYNGYFNGKFVTMTDKEYMLRLFRRLPGPCRDGDGGSGPAIENPRRDAGIVVCRDVRVDHLGNKTFGKLYSTTDFARVYHEDLRLLAQVVDN